jgi:hypothetical protein
MVYWVNLAFANAQLTGWELRFLLENRENENFFKKTGLRL